jgi:threonine/homoserine/homoserine lactone efflux protein
VVDPSVVPGFLTAIVLISVAPGPDNAYIAAVAVDRGPRAGVVSAAGMAVGMVVHVVAAALGLAALLRTAPVVLTALRLAGAAYLASLAFTTLRAARRRGLVAGAAIPNRRLLGRAVLTNLTNPKVILFFAAFLPQFVRAGHGPTWLQLLTLGGLFLLVGLAVDTVIGLAAGTLGDTLAVGSRASITLSVIAGLTFATLAGLLVLEVAWR